MTKNIKALALGFIVGILLLTVGTQLLANEVERIMANRAKQPVCNGANVQSPPEADTDFDLVPEEQIAVWNDKLKKRYGTGSGRLVVLDDVHTSAGCGDD